MRNVVFVDGVRTPFGKMGGGLRQFWPTDLAGFAIKGLVERTKILERSTIDNVFIGAALGDGHTNSIARVAMLSAGLPKEVAASFIEVQCGSAIDCVNHAAWKIATGNADVVIAGGCESYSQRFAKFSMCVEPYKLIPPTAIPGVLSPVKEESTDMITNSDLMAKRWDISREACDEFAVRSQHLAQEAITSGWLDNQIIPVTIPATRKTPEMVISKDEPPRANVTYEALAKLPSVYEGGVTTAGNASGRNDGASAVLMMSEEKALELGYTPLARWLGSAEYGCDPRYMGIAPAYSNMKLLKKFGLKLEDIAVYECNEAFAAQNLSVIKVMQDDMGGKIDMANWNPHGGAIAYGHPNGASGTKVMTFAMRELEARGGGYGLISSCCGGGVGVSTLIQRL